MHKITEQEGFTLIEVIVAIFIIAVGLLAVVGAFSGERSLVEDTKREVIVNKQIASEMENIKFTNYDNIESSDGVDVSETTVTVSLSGSTTSTTSVTVKMVTVSSSYTSTFSPGQQKTRAIKFYIYRKGINYRP